MFVLEEENRVLYDRIQEHNLARQYDLLINCIEIGVCQGVRVCLETRWKRARQVPNGPKMGFAAANCASMGSGAAAAGRSAGVSRQTLSEEKRRFVPIDGRT